MLKKKNFVGRSPSENQPLPHRSVPSLPALWCEGDQEMTNQCVDRPQGQPQISALLCCLKLYVLSKDVQEYNAHCLNAFISFKSNWKGRITTWYSLATGQQCLAILKKKKREKKKIQITTKYIKTSLEITNANKNETIVPIKVTKYVFFWEKRRFVVPHISAFAGWFLHLYPDWRLNPWPGRIWTALKQTGLRGQGQCSKDNLCRC